jgi:hypothetical protein
VDKYFGNVGGLSGWASEQIRADAWIYYLFIYLLYRRAYLINDWINAADGGR